MPAELRKRPAPASTAAPLPAKKSKATPPISAQPDKDEVSTVAPPNTASSHASKERPGAPLKAGSRTSLEIGGEILTHDNEKVTLAKLVQDSKAGVVLFTYPKASTPGCTNQVCLFRDSYDALTSNGLSIYGLSSDSPKANTNFRTKQNLPYPLLCDPNLSLIAEIGMMKAHRKTTRGVFVVDKQGHVLALEAGGPAATADVVRRLVEKIGDAPTKGVEDVKEKVVAETAAEVADTAKELDEGKASLPKLA